MDLFGNLDNFINGSDKFRLPESPEIGNSIEQETEEIEKNTRGSKVSKVSKGKKTKVTEAGSKSRKRKAPASNGHLELKEPIEIEDEVEKPSEFCPVKGQKTAWKRLNKLRDDLAKQEEELPEPAPKKAPATNKRRRGRQQPVEDVVDLISSPQLLIPGTVNLDSDEETEETINAYFKGSKDSSLSSENMEIVIKVKYTSKIEDYMLRPYQKFADLVTQLAKRHNVNEKHILLSFKDKVLLGSSTPNSIGYVSGLIINARVLSSAEGFTKEATSRKYKNDANKIKLQIQTAKQKRPFDVFIDKNDILKAVVFECAELLKCDAADIRLDFDGERLDLTKTADDMEFEGGEMIDLFIN